MSEPDGRDPMGVPPESDSAPRTLRCWLEFDGTAFEGWQRQAEGRTVQGAVEAALAQVLRTPHKVVGCGRTDAGVHALAHVVSFRTTHAMPAPELLRALDAVLPADVGVRHLEDTEPAFHAQRSAAWKWYRYRILVARRKRPLGAHGAWRLPEVPPLERLQTAASGLVGTHDFLSFANSGSSPGKTTVRTVHHVRVERRGPFHVFDVVGDGFLYKMVRTIVGTLLAAAGNEDPRGAIDHILAARDRTQAGRAAPAGGLCLMAVGLRGESPPQWVPLDLLPPLQSSPTDRLETRT